MLSKSKAQRVDSDSVDRCLSLKALAVMVQRYGELPPSLWDLCKNMSDFKENRKVKLSEQIGVSDLHSLLNTTRFNIVELELDDTFNKPLPPLPRGLKILICGESFTHDLTLNDGLDKLRVGNSYNKNLFLPDSLKCLSIGNAYDKLLVLPQNLEELCVGDLYNEMLALNPKLKKLVLGDAYTRPLVLPQGIEMIGLGDSYNQVLNLPDSVRAFGVGDGYSVPLTLPEGLEDLYIGHGFNEPITIPPTLKKLDVGDSFDRPLILRDGIEEVHVGMEYNRPLSLPASVRVITVWFAYTHPLQLPEGVVEANLLLGTGYQHHIRLPSSLKKVTLMSKSYASDLPSGLESLAWCGSGSIGSLPDGLKELSIQHPEFNDPLTLPASITSVDFGAAFNFPVYLPHGLKELSIGAGYTFPLTLPDTLVKASFDLSDSYPYTIHLPPGLLELNWKYGGQAHRVGFGLGIVQLPVDLRVLNWASTNPVGQLPPNLICASFTGGFNYPVELPATLEAVYFEDDYAHRVDLPQGCVRMTSLSQFALTEVS